MDQTNKFLALISVIFIALGALFLSESGVSESKSKLKIVFCDVGQGDGMLITAPNGDQIVVDGGIGSRITDCLGENMPFDDRTVELMIMTHPHQDHLEGQIEIFERYEVEKVGWSGVETDTAVFEAWITVLENEQSDIFIAKAGDQIVIENISFDILWPTQTQLKEWITDPPSDLNDVSVVSRINFGSFCAYLTGDVDKTILETIIDKPCSVLKVSHHGSRTGTNQKIIDLISPEVSVIQVGEKNRYKHPHQEALDILNGTQILRNDELGNIEISSDGTSYSIN